MTTRRHIPADIVQEIRAMYAEPTRSYHNLNHIDYLENKIGKVMVDFDQYKDHFNGLCYEDVMDRMKLAILFHDAIYNIWSDPTINEIRSASLLEFTYSDRLINAGWTKDEILSVIQCILATGHHTKDQSNADPLVKLFLDLDIIAMAESTEIAIWNRDQIFNEYMPKCPNYETFLINNAKFLQALVNRENVLYSPVFQKYEETIRSNIRLLIESANEEM